MNFQFSIFKQIFLILLLSTLLLAAPGAGLGQENFVIKVTKIKANAIYTEEVELNWVLYDTPLTKQEITLKDKYAGSAAQTKIQAIPGVGGAFDLALGVLLLGLKLDIDPGRTDKEIVFKDALPGHFLVYKEYKAKSQTMDFKAKLATGIEVKFWIEMGAGAGAGTGIQNPLKADTFQELVERLIDFVFIISVAVAPLMLLVSGFLFLTAGGAPDKIGRAKAMILWTIIGFAVVMLAKGMLAVVEQVLGG